MRLEPTCTLLKLHMAAIDAPREMKLPLCTRDEILSILLVQMQSLNIQIVKHASLECSYMVSRAHDQ